MMILNNELLNKLHSIELLLLKEFDRICKENDIKYYLCAGTLLGAVRHSGFIPWDDDVDVIMPRSDFDKFREIFSVAASKGFFLHSKYNDPNYPWDFMKLRLDGTKYVKASELCLRHYGLWIDIFPLDCATASKVYLLRHFKIRNDLFTTYYVNKLMKPQDRTLKWRIMLFFIRPIVAHKLDSITARYYIHKLYGNHEDPDYWCETCSTYTFDKVLYKNEWIEPYKEILFCDLVARVPNDAHAVLTTMYGDYMKLPPEEKRQSHHEVDYYDFG